VTVGYGADREFRRNLTRSDSKHVLARERGGLNYDSPAPGLKAIHEVR